jgi:hypothetical protein
MNTSHELHLTINWCGARETMVTHLKNISELSQQLGLTKIEIRDYLLNRLDTPSIHIEGNTIKIAGFVTEPIFKMIFDQYNKYIEYKNCKIV